VGLRFLQNILLPVGCVLLLQTATVAWEGPADNKPEAELQAMDDPTLAWEARGPCMKAAITTFVVTTGTVAERKEALRYLSMMLEIKRKQGGKVPPWLYELTAQAERGDVQGCTDVAKKVYLPPETSPEEQVQDQQQTSEQAAQEQDKTTQNK
jgi:hypothetical protein